MNRNDSTGDLVPAIDPAQKRRQELEGRRAAQAHSAALADLKDEKVEGSRDRRERRADRREERALAKLNRQAKVSGARVRIAHELSGSGEVRALRIVKVRKVMLSILLPVLIAFAAWSTIGVHAGVTKLMGVGSSDPMWTGAWFVEPGLATIVVGIILARAALRMSGGDLDGRATAIEWGALTVSLVLNLAGVWPDGDWKLGVAAMVAHSIGPIGTMMTAVLISVIDDGVNKAKPFEGVPSMSESVVLVDSRESTHPESTHRLTRVDSRESTHEAPSESVVLTHRLDVESPGDESGESTHPRPAESVVSESPQRKPRKVTQASVEPVADRRQLVFNTYDAAIGAGQEPSHAWVSQQTGVPKPTVTRYLKSRVDSPESTHGKINESTH